jgi:hypothetical protein
MGLANLCREHDVLRFSWMTGMCGRLAFMQWVIAGVETKATPVKAGGELAVSGFLSGPADVTGTLWVNFEGTASGPVTVRDGGHVIVDGVLTGPVTVERGGDVLVTMTGSSLGPLTNHGSVRVAGAIAASTSGLPPEFIGSRRIVDGDTEPRASSRP